VEKYKEGKVVANPIFPISSVGICQGVKVSQLIDISLHSNAGIVS
jgi:hypothetical protein